MAIQAKPKNDSSDIWWLIVLLAGLFALGLILNGGNLGKDDSYYCEEAYTNGQYYEQCHDFRDEDRKYEEYERTMREYHEELDY